MSSDEYSSPPPRKRGRPTKLEKESPVWEKKKSDEEMDGIHYACNVCEQVFLHKANYLRHSKRHDPPGGFVCSICQQPFTTEWDRNKHKRVEHSVFRCRLCKAEFPMEDDYNNHIQIEHAGRDREYDMCPTCGQQFRSTSQLKVHVESKCGTEKKHECEECHSRYLTQASLNAHMIKHMGEKSHLCNYCGASFLNKGQLKVHERMHTGEKPYKCNQCDKAFAHRESLITHSTTHSGIKPYYCSYCESRFSCIGNLLKHRRARPETCGLPQYCLTNKIVARPNIKTMPSLIDRQVYTNKVSPQSGPSRKRKAERDESPESKPVVVKKRTAIKAAPPSDNESDDNTYDSPEEEPLEEKPKAAIKQFASKQTSPKQQHQKLVTLKVETDHKYSEDSSDSEAQQTLDEKHILPVDSIETMEVKIEDSEDFVFEEVIQEETVSDSGEQEITYETNDDSQNNETEERDNEDHKQARGHYSDDAGYYDNDDSEDYKPPELGPKGVRRSFTHKPPVITERKRRGRPRQPVIPKRENSDVIIIDIKAKKRTQNAQRALFDSNITRISSDCYACSNCPSQYTSEYMVGRHLEREHGMELNELLVTLQYGKQFPRDKTLQCRYCQRLYANEKALEKHIPLHGPDGLLIHKCPCCRYHYATEDEAMEHAFQEHRDRLECPICEKRFVKPLRLMNHVKYFHEVKKEGRKQTYVCPICGKNFSSRMAVNNHERSNCGRNPFYKCEVCLKNFTTAATLKSHYLVHTDDFPFSCQYCGKSYKTNGQVKVHERTHTGEKPFACEYCPKTFGHRETLHTHLSLHTGIKRYICSGCGSRYTCISNLQAHRRSHKSTCGSVPNVARVVGPPGSGYQGMPEGYEFPYPKEEYVQ